MRLVCAQDTLELTLALSSGHAGGQLTERWFIAMSRNRGGHDLYAMYAMRAEGMCIRCRLLQSLELCRENHTMHGNSSYGAFSWLESVLFGSFTSQ